MKKYKAIIKNITKNTFFVDFTDQVLKETNKEKKATVFHDENDAELELEALNNYLPDCYTLLIL